MIRNLTVLIAGVLLAASSLIADELMPAQLQDCPTVVRAYFNDRAMVNRLSRWTEPWEVRDDESYVVLGVDAEGFGRLVAEGFEIEIDERLTDEMCRPLGWLQGQVSGIPGYPCYRTVEETFAAAAQIASDHPDLAEWIDIGDSWEKTSPGGLPGYDMMVLKLTNSAVAGTPTGAGARHGKPRLFVTSAIHARELTTAELMLRFAEYLVDNYGIDADATWILDQHEVHLLLHTNPDGRKHAETGEWWRKNTNEDYCGPTDPYRGADLNRNFEFEWSCCGGSSGDECAETYRGPVQASEPEVQAVQDYARSIFPDQRADPLSEPAPDDATGVYIDVHSHGMLVLWAWGFTADPPPNGTAMQTLGRKLAYFNGHEPKQAIGLYATDGTTTDFGYGDLGIAAYTFELGTSFFQSCPTFESTILPNNLESLIYAAKVPRTPYLTPGGPEALDVAFPSGNVVSPGESVAISAVADDTRFNSSHGSEPTQNVVAAELYIDLPPWDSSAPSPQALTAADGAFDSSIEAVQGNAPTTGITEGRHIVFLRARDAADNWGPVSAGFFYVFDPATSPRIEGIVNDSDTGDPLEATIAAGGFATRSSPVDGSYSLMLPAGTYDVIATADEHAPMTASGVVAVSGQITPLDFDLEPYHVVLSDDVEGGNIGWTAQSPWAITTEASASPSHSWTDSPGGNYQNGADVSLTSPSLDLRFVGSVTLEFKHIFDLEAGWDFGRVEYSVDGTTWNEVAAYDGVQSSWVTVSLALPALDGAASARVRCRLDADSWENYDGWHIDDIVIRGADAYPTDLIFYDGFEGGGTGGWSHGGQ